MTFIDKIRRILKKRFDLISNENLKKNLLNALPFWLGALISGGIAVMYAKLFALAESGTKYLYLKTGYFFLVIPPACFVLGWIIVNKYAPFARGSGIPQVTAAIELSNPKHNYKVNALLSWKIIFIKIISSLITVFGGGVIGREGPTIQLSASVFKKINDWLPDWYPRISKRNMIVTGAASGLAAAFNTPLGGIVFAIEELTKTHFSLFKSALLTGVIIAGLTALSLLGPYLYLGYPDLNVLSPWLILAVIPLAVLTGFAGSGMGSVILYIFRRKRSFTKTNQHIMYAAVCGLIIALLGVFLSTRAMGSGRELMVTTLFTSEKHVSWYLPILRIAGPILTFSTGASGGIFAPSLSAGASVGAAFAGWFHLNGSETNLLILCGMAGVLTSITRSPFTSSILVLEMTNSHNVIFYIMLTALLSNLFANMVSRHAFYDVLKDQYVAEVHKSEIQQSDTHENDAQQNETQ